MSYSRALIVIDYTVDFVAEEGALTCGEPGQKIENAIHQLIETSQAAGDFIVFALDRHEEGDAYHPETELFPSHNIAGTKGRDLYRSIQSLYETIQHQPNVWQMDKTRYSAFAGTSLEMKLRERGITELHLVGVCTDICILHTAVDAYNKGFNIIIHQDAVASFDEAGHAFALKHAENILGAAVL
ncbi:cysteine hydrolase family protein [Marinococcus halophilus]|uniref:cysteine hydrolase family protein n=1 Tax=Marinococcus halophilus TaxID=1371 RepID=UPI0009A663B8|nr:isochorismatase family cysteine hydrolase [Marinococcus halophilus]